MQTYDESSITRRLAAVDRKGKTAFAAACAQRLVPLYERYAQAVPAADAAALHAIVRTVWEVLRGQPTDLRPQEHLAQELVPDEDDENWVPETAYAQNAAAAAAYAVRTWLTDDAQEAAWASLQAYEAADYAAQAVLGDTNLNASDAESQLLGHDIVQTALDAIESDLRSVETEDPDVEVLAARATTEGRVWSKGMP